MTGPEHLSEAERLLAEQCSCRAAEPCRFCHRALMRAQVHALTALTLTVAEVFGADGPWKEVPA